jgi:hypothetical protein
MSNKERLNSWKEIAEYVDKGVRTCIRWEKELGLPIYRVDKKSSHSRVFTYKKEIDQWFKKRAEEQKQFKNTCP